MEKSPVFQSMWIGDRLSDMEKMSINSFLKNGHIFHLYVYNEVKDIPKGVTIKDAGKIISSDRIFKYKKFNSYSGFANLFRYKLLHEKGNYWVDLDIICLKPFTNSDDYVFASERLFHSFYNKQESFSILKSTRNLASKFYFYGKSPFYHKGLRRLNCCLIKAPLGSEIMEYCYHEAALQNPEKLQFGQTGAQLLTNAVEKFNMWNIVSQPQTFCPIDWWDWKRVLSEMTIESIAPNSQTIHFWQEMWRRTNLDKSRVYPEKSVYQQLKNIYLNK